MAKETREDCVVISSFSSKGYGIGLVQSKEVEVAHTVPGDRASISWKKKRYPPQKGRLLSVESPSPDRVVPPCPHVGICGGCSWQQVAYAAQLQEKEKRIRALFPKEDVLPIVPAPSLFRYRNKMEFSFSQNRAGTSFLGLMIAQAEPYVFSVQECHLCAPWFSKALFVVRSWWERTGLLAYNPREDRGVLRYLTLREGVRTGQKMAVLNVSCHEGMTQEHIADFVACLQAEVDPSLSLFLRIHQTKKGVPTQFFEMHLGGAAYIEEEMTLFGKKFSFSISPSSFFQPNTVQAERLYTEALSFLEKTDVVYDLYCGTGTLGMVAAQKACAGIGIDSSPQAILDATENAKKNGVDNIRFFEGDVGNVLHKTSLPPPSVVIVDPPRAGLDERALSFLLDLSPSTLVYISCNPTTQKENIERFLAKGYKIVHIQPVDQFPHTYHIENIVRLVR